MTRRIKQHVAHHKARKKHHHEKRLGTKDLKQQGPHPEHRGEGSKFDKRSGEWDAK